MVAARARPRRLARSAGRRRRPPPTHRRRARGGGRARVVRHPYNKGNGAAVKTGIRGRAGRGRAPPWTRTASTIPEDMRPPHRGRSACTTWSIGALLGHATSPRRAPLGNAVFRRSPRWPHRAGPSPTSPPASGPRVATACSRSSTSCPTASRIRPPPASPSMKAGHNVTFVPVTAHPRVGTSKIRVLRDGVRFVLIILKIVTLYSPLKVFFPISACSFLLGPRLRDLERRRARQDPDGIGAPDPARGGGVPLRPHLGADRRRYRPGVILPSARAVTFSACLLPAAPARGGLRARPGRGIVSSAPETARPCTSPLRALVWELCARRASGVEPRPSSWARPCSRPIGRARSIRSCRSWPSFRPSQPSRSSSSCPLAALRRPRLPLFAAPGRGARGARSWAGSASRFGLYLVAHLADTATLVAAPLLPLVLLAAEDHSNAAGHTRARGRPRRQPRPPPSRRLSGGGLRGAALVAGRLVVGHVADAEPARAQPARASSPSWPRPACRPQLVPTLVLARDAGRSATGLANRDRPLAGLLRPRAALRVAHPGGLARPGRPASGPDPGPRSACSGLALALCLAFAVGAWSLSRPGAPGLSLRADPVRARRPLALRAVAGAADGRGCAPARYFLTAAIASAAVAVRGRGAVGPLPESLAGAVGVLALSLILYFSLAPSPHTACAGLWTAAPDRVLRSCSPGGPASVGLLSDGGRHLRGQRHPPRALERRWALARTAMLALVRDWPRGPGEGPRPRELGGTGGRPLRQRLRPDGPPPHARRPSGGMGVGGTSLEAFLPARSRRGWRCSACAGCRCRPPRWPPARVGFAGEPVDVAPEPGRLRCLPSCPWRPPPRVQIDLAAPDAVGVAQGQEVARCGGAPGHRPQLLSSSLRAGWTPRSGPWGARTCGHAWPISFAPVFNTWTDPGTRLRPRIASGRLRRPAATSSTA